MRPLLRFVPLLLALAACRTAPAPSLAAPTGPEATIFVHGYKGSFLAEADGEHAWLTPGETLSSGDRSLALPFAGQRPGERFGPLHPDGPLTKLSIAFISSQIYLGFLEFGHESLPGFMAFSYDWRGDVRGAADALCAEIARLPVERVNVVAHSMGGLITLHCLRAGAPKIRRVVFVGTPFAGSPLLFKDLLRGDSAGRNHALLSAEALFTFASAWQLLPPRSSFFAGSNFEAFTAAPWLERGLGVFQDASLRNDPAYLAQLGRMIDAHAGHWNALDGFVPAVPTLAVVGLGHDTVAAVTIKDGAFDLDHPTMTDGDGTVSAASARPAFPHELLERPKGHVEILDDPEVHAAILRFLGQPAHSSR